MTLVKINDVVYGGLWRILPVINVDRVKDIPEDYPGAMGVPITFMNYMQKNDGKTGFILLGIIRPTLHGKKLYKRLLVRNLRPKLPEEFDIDPFFDKERVVISRLD